MTRIDFFVWVFQIVLFLIFLGVLVYFLHKFRLEKMRADQAADAVRKLQIEMQRSEKTQAYSQFFAGIAHQLNNPLNAVNGNITLLKDAIDLYGSLLQHTDTTRLDENTKNDLAYFKSEIPSVFSDIEQSIQRAVAIVAKLQKLQREFPLTKEKLVLRETITQILPFFASGNHLTPSIQHNYPANFRVLANPVNFVQVMQNIIMNAVESAPERVVDITISATQSPTTTTIDITDNGSGLPPQWQENPEDIFEPFHSTKIADGFAGMGLAICRNIMTLHKGSIALLREMENGLGFRLVFPNK
jgi:signal transduction histidine kinase